MLYDANKIPKPEDQLNGKIYDETGHTLNPTKEARGLMVKADEKLSEKIPLSKGTILLLSAGPAILMLVFSYGGSMLGWAREDQSTKERLIQTGVDMQRMVESQKRIEEKLADFDKRLREQERFQDKTSSYKLGKADAEESK